MPTSQSRRLETLRRRCTRALAAIQPEDVDARAGELIGLLLMDLDRLTAWTHDGSQSLPGFAAAFVDKRLARRLAANYGEKAFREEVERRFRHAAVTAPNVTYPGYEQILVRLGDHVQRLERFCA